VVTDRQGMGVIRLGTAILAEARAERISWEVCQLPITVPTKDTAFIADLVVYAGNVFVAITAQPGRLYEVVDARAVGWIRNQTQQKLGSRIDTTCRDDVADKRLASPCAGTHYKWIVDLMNKIARSILVGANATRSRKPRDAQIRKTEVCG